MFTPVCANPASPLRESTPVILLIGPVCCGKTTYARQLPGTLLLSCDALMQTLFPGGCGEDHDVLATRARAYLFTQARQAALAGMTPVLDFGFWTQEMRQEAIAALSGLRLDWRYLSVSPEEWARRIAKRNAAQLAGQGDPADYFVDEELLGKVNALFQPPTEAELPGLTVITE